MRKKRSPRKRSRDIDSMRSTTAPTSFSSLYMHSNARVDMGIDILGYVGLALVFVSFIVKKWWWLYAFNLCGTILLAIYAYLIKSIVFTVLEVGIAILLTYRFINELRQGRVLEKSR